MSYRKRRKRLISHVKEIRERRHAGESCNSIAKDFNTVGTAIHRIGYGGAYPQLNDMYPPVKKIDRVPKITPKIKKVIRRLWSLPNRAMTLGQIAAKFGVSEPYIYRIAVGQR